MSDISRSGNVSERGRGNASVEHSVSPEAARTALHVVDVALSELYVRAQGTIAAEQQPIHSAAAEIAARVGSAVPLAVLQAQQPQAAERTEQNPQMGFAKVPELASQFVSATVEMPSTNAIETELLTAADENDMEARARQAVYAAHAQREAEAA